MRMHSRANPGELLPRLFTITGDLAIGGCIFSAALSVMRLFATFSFLDERILYPVESGLSSALASRDQSLAHRFKGKSKSIAIQQSAAHGASDDIHGLALPGEFAIRIDELRNARRLNQMATIANTIMCKGHDNRPALCFKTFVIKACTRVGDFGHFAGARFHQFIDLALDGREALIQFCANSVDAASHRIVPRLGILDTLFRRRQAIHCRKKRIFCSFEIVGNQINLHRILRVFLVAVETCLGDLELLYLVSKSLSLGFDTLDSVFQQLKIGFGSREVCHYAGEPRQFKRFSAR